jgi:hypothetical protein
MPAGDVFGLDGFFLNVSNPVVVSTIGINSTAAGAGITVVSGVLNATAGIATLTFSTAAGLSTTPFYVGAKIAVSGLNNAGVAYTGYNGNFVVTGFAGTTTVSYATTGYVGGVTAGITTTGLVMLVTDTQVTNTTWSTSQTHGWFGGGGSTVDRIDFSNDTGTATARGPLSSGRGYLAATGNSNYGWFGGGTSPTPAVVSIVNRIDFSNDSATTTARGPLSLARQQFVATGNSNYGWFGGGTSPTPAVVSIVNRIDFSNDSSTASPRGPLSSARLNFAATGNSNYGWFGGGYTTTPTPTTLSTVDRIDFSNDLATATARGPLSSARSLLRATGNSNYGWFGGGFDGTRSSRVDRIDFSNDTGTATARGPLSLGRSGLAATGNSNYGWFGGGYSPTQSTVDRIDFSNDSSTASPRGPLSSARSGLAATSGQARSSSTRLQKAGNYGWFGGGSAPGPQPTNRSSVDRIDFSNDSSTASPRGNILSAARYSSAATGNSNYGWFGGGYSFPPATRHSLVDRIDFSNDSATASVRGPLSTIKINSTATGNFNYSWFFGGKITISPQTTTAIVDRIDFSNDLAQASPRGPLSVSRYGLAATGNSNYGWFAGGEDNSFVVYSRIDRIDFSNDNGTASLRSVLSGSKYNLAATGNSNYGWFGGGTPGPGSISKIDRIDFSNDTAGILSRGLLNVARRNLATTGNSNYGWFGGGDAFPARYSTVERINFSNDSISALPRGLLNTEKSGLAATSNTPT